MDKEFVPQEQSLELKELGFDEKCFSYIKHLGYDISKEKIRVLSEISRSQIEDMGIPLLKIPTYSQAFRWFREKYDLNFYVWKKEDLFRIVLQRPFENSYFFNDEFNTYEEAELECLKKLIEIVKEKNGKN